MASSVQRKEKRKEKEKEEKETSRKPFQSWLRENMEQGKKMFECFFFFFLCSVLLVGVFLPEDMESQQCSM